MTTTRKELIPSGYVENTQTTQYTADGVTATIHHYTVTNVGASNATFSLNLVASGDSAAADNLIIDAKTIVPGQTYIVPISGAVLENGSFISTIASAASTLVHRCSGDEKT